MQDKYFIQGISLIEIATQKNFTEDQVKLYKMLLSDIEDEQFINGVTRLLRERVYTNIPAPAEIREYCLELKENDLNYKIAEAKNSIKKAISLAGMYRNVAFEDPVIHALIKNFGSWTKICKATTEEFEDFIKWEVPKLYRSLTTRKIDVELLLTGITYNPEKEVAVTYIGNEEKIKLWQEKYIEKRIGLLPPNEVIKAKQLGFEIKEGVVNKIIYKENSNKMIEDLRAE